MNVSNLLAYECVKQQTIEGIGSEAYLLRHKKSGAMVVVMENNDNNKVFNIGFRTTPTNSTGVPHIIEHTVLCGSRKFPGKDPFVELIKGSLNTFINAMTYPDKTIYPIASCNDKDFKNLMDVYLDAVFYPNIYKHKEIFMQEGWNYKLTDKDSPLEISGVVYNEMKGAYSTPESVLDRLSMNSLFPSNTYAFSSGGDPKHIPDLTYEEFISFHKKYYHPSNSYIYLYGDMDMEERLVFLDEEYLSNFEEKEIDSEISLQEPFKEIKKVKGNYAITKDEPVDNNTFLGYTKVVGGALDPELYMAFQILDYALLSAPGAPLKKALLDAGIGSEISGGYDNAMREPLFEISVKGANAADEEKFVKVVDDTLIKLSSEGINKNSLESAINYMEFRYKEADFGYWPKGLMYMLKLFDSWLYDKNLPFIHIDSQKVFDLMKEKVSEGYFEEIIKKYLIENKHAVVCCVEPKIGLTEEEDKKLREKLEEYKSSLTSEEIESIVNKTKALKEYQEEPETKENLEKIPVIELKDIKRDPLPLKNELLRKDLLFHEVETNGIAYVNFLFNIGGIKADDIFYASILQAVLGLVDTKNYSYSEFFNEVNTKTGGIGTSINTYNKIKYARVSSYEAVFSVRTKALYDKIPFAFEMIKEMLFTSNINDEKRIKEILLEIKAKMQRKFSSAGHMTAVRRSASYRNPKARFREEISGIEFYDKVSNIIDNYDEEKEKLFSNLSRLVKTIFTKNRLLVSVTCEGKEIEKISGDIDAFVASLDDGEAPGKMAVLPMSKKNEGISSASKVQYVAVTGNYIKKGYEYTGALEILKVILSYDYLWQNIRVKGGAYGCMSGFNRSGEGYFTSYRDPNLKNTFKVYEGISNYLENFNVSDRDMKKYIIGAISNMDHPLTPAEVGERSLNAYLSGITFEMLKKERIEVLDATKEDIRKLSLVVDAVLSCDQKCVVGKEEVIEENRDVFKEIRSFN